MSQNAALSCQNLLACCSTDLKCKQRFRQTGQQGSFLFYRSQMQTEV